MKIVGIKSFEVLDSNGFPAISLEVLLDNNEVISTSMSQDVLGCDVNSAINFINQELKDILLVEAESPIDVDAILLDLDGTKHKTNLAKGLMLLVSMSMYKAYARLAKQDLFDYIATLGGYESVSLPIPLISILGSDNLFEGYFVVPYGAKSVRNALDLTLSLVNSVDDNLSKVVSELTLNKVGAFENPNKTYLQSLKFLSSEINKTPDVFAIGIDARVSKHFNQKAAEYSFGTKKLKYSDVIDFYKDLLSKFNILFFEDALDDIDWEGWINMNIALENDCNLIARDILKSDINFISKAIEYDIASTISLNPFKIGTITESIQLIKLCQQYGMAVSLDLQGENTTENFFADLAVGCSVNYTKFGGIVGGEHVSKYNRLLAIENILIDHFS